MKNKPDGSTFESLFPSFTKTDQYKIYAIDKQLQDQSDALNKMIETSGKTKLPEKLKKLMEYQVKNLNDPRVSKQIDMMVQEYASKAKIGKRQLDLLSKQQKQIKDARQQAKKLGFDRSVSEGFSMAGLEGAVAGRGLRGGIAAGAKYTGRSIATSMRQMSLSGMAKGAMHFAGGALDTPALNILASSIGSSRKQNDSMLELMKEFNDSKAEEKSSFKSSGSKSSIIGSEGGVLEAIKEVGDISMETASETEAVKMEAISMGKTLTSIDSKIGEMLFMYKDSLNDKVATRQEYSSGGTRSSDTTATEPELTGDGLDMLLGGSGGKSRRIAGKLRASSAFLKKAVKFLPGIGAMVGLVMTGYDAFTGATDDNAIAQFEGVRPEEITMGQRIKHGAANAASSLTFGLVKPETFLGDPSKFNPEDKDYIRNMVKGSESKGDYGLASVLGDNAGLTAGAYQFTEKSGSLGKMMEAYAIKQRNAGIYNNFLPSDITQGLKKGSLTADQRSTLSDYIRKQASNNPEMFQQAQDATYNEMYLDPALSMAGKYGLTDKSAVAMFADHFVNRGAGGAESFLKGIQSSGVDMSTLTAEDIAKYRKEDYSKLIARDPSKAKFARGWSNRVDENLTALQSGATMPTLPDVPTTAELDIDELAKKTGQEVAKAMAEQKDKTAEPPSVIKATGNQLNKYALEDTSDGVSWKAMTGND